MARHSYPYHFGTYYSKPEAAYVARQLNAANFSATVRQNDSGRFGDNWDVYTRQMIARGYWDKLRRRPVNIR